MEDLGVVILAAGKGTRMNSDLPKVLHKIYGKSMVAHVIDKAGKLGSPHIHVVVGHKSWLVKKDLQDIHGLVFVEQEKLLGTGDAVKSVIPYLKTEISHIIVLCGDVPLIRHQTLANLLNVHKAKAASLTLLTVSMDEPKGYGRVICDGQGRLDYIREEADASEEEKKICLVNSGVYCFDRKFLVEAIDHIRPDNNQAEYYLTDLVKIGKKLSRPMEIVITEDPYETAGVNTQEELQRAISVFES